MDAMDSNFDFVDFVDFGAVGLVVVVESNCESPVSHWSGWSADGTGLNEWICEMVVEMTVTESIVMIVD